MKRVLAVVAHPDDEVLGVGGTLAKHVLAGDDVAVLILCWRSLEHHDASLRAANSVGHRVVPMVLVPDRYDQCFDEIPIKNLAREIGKVASGIVPETVYLHSPKDLNQDHQRAAHATLIACRPSAMPSVRELLAFETPSSSEWGLQPFAPTLFVELGAEELRRKDAAWQCYAALEGQAPNLPRSVPGLLALEQWRGRTVGVNAAEAFEVLRMVR